MSRTVRHNKSLTLEIFKNKMDRIWEPLIFLVKPFEENYPCNWSNDRYRYIKKQNSVRYFNV